ncbi:MAG: hypothetical protein GY719_37015 [bacterium]|nr:hypothetical protein [bacterium]
MQKKRTRPRDANLRALDVVRQATEEEPEPEPAAEAPPEPEKNPAAVALGRLGGKVGGKARAEKLSPERRQEIARTAAAARWAKRS